jgi:membrane protease YdiL (CAAX protease family)
MENKRKNLKTWATGSPFFFALAFFIISSCLDIGIILTGQHVVSLGNVGIVDVVVQSLLALGVLIWLGWLRAAGFNGPLSWRDLYLLWVPALLALFYLASAFVTPVSGVGVIVFAVIAALLTGLDEEARFRGVILQSLLPSGPLAAAALSGLFFGLAHLNNLLTHVPPAIVLVQAVGAFLLGFGFAACRLRTRTIWPLILFHALYDLPADITLFNAGKAGAIIATLSTLSLVTIALVLIIPGLILACYGLFLLRSPFSGE